MSYAEDVEGTVEQVNDRGVRIHGSWYNVSKFHAVALPRVGEHVRLGIDTKGFILDVERMDQDDRAVEIVLPDPTATRLTVLNAAAIFGASRGDLKSAEVLRIADAWLAWVEGSPHKGDDR